MWHKCGNAYNILNDAYVLTARKEAIWDSVPSRRWEYNIEMNVGQGEREVFGLDSTC
jgi:hypothetical protein